MYTIDRNNKEQFNKHIHVSHLQDSTIKTLFNIPLLHTVNVGDFLERNDINFKLNVIDNVVNNLNNIKSYFNNAGILNNITLDEENYLSSILNDKLKDFNNKLEDFNLSNNEGNINNKINNFVTLLNEVNIKGGADDLKLRILQSLNNINNKKNDVNNLIWTLDISLILIVLLEQSIKVNNSMSIIIKNESQLQQALNDKLQSMTAFLTAISRIYNDAIIIANKDKQAQDKKKDINWNEIVSGEFSNYHWGKIGNKIIFDKELFSPPQYLIDKGYITLDGADKNKYNFTDATLKSAVKDLTKEINEVLGRNIDPDANFSLVLSSVSLQNLIDQQTQTGQRIMTQQNAFISSLQQSVDIVNTLVEITNRCIGQLIIGNKS